MKKTIIYLLGIFILSSCTSEIGKWSDNIKLSAKNVTFSAEADSVTITTQGDEWWINNVHFQDSTYHHKYTENNFSDEFLTISDADFTVKKMDKHTIFIKMNENKTRLQKKMLITLEDGDYFDHISITQKAKE